tara:strand:- start:72 stop:755 length:684 start_codon:yes stop_codon:yes gene_type:complete
MNQIKKNIKSVEARINEAANACGRDPNTISLLAVTKSKPAQMVKEAYDAGCTSFGENYLQDAIPKINELKDLMINWHFIGKIQSNKTADIAKYFQWVHSLDQLKHAKKLNDYRSEKKDPLQCCIQVNMTGEKSKGGITPENAHELSNEIKSLANLQLRGLMTLTDPNQSKDQQLHTFMQLAKLKEDLNKQDLNLDILSIGMSGDLDLAIKAGSTIVRIGTDIFGARN